MEINDDGNSRPSPLGDPGDDDTLFDWRMMKFARDSVLFSAGYEKRQRLISGDVLDRVRTAFEIFTTCTTDEVVDLVNCLEDQVIRALEELVARGEIFIGDLGYNLGLPDGERLPIWARDVPSFVDIKSDIVQ